MLRNKGIILEVLPPFTVKTDSKKKSIIFLTIRPKKFTLLKFKNTKNKKAKIGKKNFHPKIKKSNLLKSLII